MTTDEDGEVSNYFSLWSFGPDTAEFVMVREVTPSLDKVVVTRDIEWLGGEAPPQDICHFTVCEEEGMWPV